VWSVADVIDFDAALDTVDSASAANDRAVFVDRIVPELGGSAGDRRAVFLAWLQARRAQGLAPVGRTYERVIRLVRVCAAAAGLLIGLATTAGLLSEAGSHPINAPMFLAVTVGTQLAVAVLVLAAMAARAAGADFTPVTSAMRALVQLAFTRMSGDRRTALQHLAATLGDRSSRLAPLVGPQLLQLTQAFAIAFNVGILAAMLLVYLPFLDLRFGWQSTYSFGPAFIVHAVDTIAAPWRWISESLAPSHQQVLTTGFARGQSALALDAASAHAWWPFLLCAVAVYGLLPRLVVAAVAAGVLRWRLRRLSFDHPAANALWRRLHGPMIVSEGGDERLPSGLPQHTRDHGRPQRALTIRSDACELGDAQVVACVRHALGWTVERTVTACIDDDSFGSALAEALRARPDAVAVVAPAAQNPIVAIAGFLKALADAIGPGHELVVLLAGAPGELETRQTIWSRFVALHRLRAGVETCR
jgi:hypothetical protein